MPDVDVNAGQNDETVGDDAGTTGGEGQLQPTGAGLTQAQVNALVGEARKRGRASAVSELLAQFEAGDVNALRGLVDSGRQAQAEIDRLKGEIETLQTERTNAQRQAREVTLREALRAGGVGSKQLTAALALLDVADDADADAIGEAVKGLVGEHDYLLEKQAKPTPTDGGTRPTSPPEESDEERERRLTERYPALRL